MPDVTVTTGNSARIVVTNPTILSDIHAKVQSTGNRPAVEFRRDTAEVALVFTDAGEIALDVTDFLTELEAVDDAGGAFLVYAADPTPVNPPPPDTLCPC